MCGPVRTDDGSALCSETTLSSEGIWECAGGRVIWVVILSLYYEARPGEVRLQLVLRICALCTQRFDSGTGVLRTFIIFVFIVCAARCGRTSS